VGQPGTPTTMYVGKAGDGYFYIGEASTFTLYGNMVVGDQVGVWGSFIDQGGGTATVTGSVTLGNQPGAFGEYDLYNDGSSVIKGDLVLGNQGPPSGYDPNTEPYSGAMGGYFLSGGSLTVGQEGASANMVVGAGGLGAVSHDGGTATVYGNLILGRDAGGLGGYSLLNHESRPGEPGHLSN
jgi:hypothetical protein